MSRFLRFSISALLPVLTLVLGTQIGAQYERHRLESTAQYLENLYSGTTSSGQILQDPEKEANIELMWGVWRLLNKHYIEPNDLQAQEMVYGATAGMVQAIGDPYTVFMTPPENSDFHMSLEGKLEGIGAELMFKDESVVIVAPLKGSPAAAAGLEPGDVIARVDGTDVGGESLSAVVRRIRGPKGTSVKLDIFREGATELLTFDIMREAIVIPSVESEVKQTQSGSIGYLALNQFGEQTLDDAKKALEAMRAKNPTAMIVDLRYNGGGFLEGAVELTSLFMNQGKVVTVERRAGKADTHYAYGRPLYPDIPLAILINEGSASASEIVAGALQDVGRAVIVGKKSFGKGTVQEVMDLPGGSSLRVTTAKWLTPNGRDLSKEGVHPDIEIDRTRDDALAERDPQLAAAIEWLTDKEALSGAVLHGTLAEANE